jgi:Tol biopolymer transport system component
MMPPNKNPKAVVKSSAKDYFPDVSSDNTRLVFVSDRTGFRELWLKDLGTGEETQLTSFNSGLILMPRWNGDSVIFTYRDESGSRLYNLDLQNRQVLPIDTSDKEARFGIRLKETNELVWSSREDSNWQLLIDQTDSKVMANKDVYNLVQIPNENNLYYSDNHCDCIYQVNLNSSNQQELDLPKWAVFPGAWLITKKYFYHYEAGTKWTDNQLVQLDRNTGEKRILASFNRFLAYDSPSLTIHHDSQTLYYTSFDEVQTDLWLYQIND